ncbi:MAG: Hpt domain-containing protein [Oscillospiraceae bacterium]|nr:Hpt domain-containing protein [Oscillospiraceae bacterium]
MGKLKGINAAKGLDIVGGNAALYQRLLKKFNDNTMCEDLLAAIRGGNAAEIREAAHALKGVSANLGLDLLFQRSQEIEQTAKNGEAVAPSDPLVSALAEESAQTKASIQAVLDNPGLLSK